MCSDGSNVKNFLSKWNKCITLWLQMYSICEYFANSKFDIAVMSWLWWRLYKCLLWNIFFNFITVKDVMIIHSNQWITISFDTFMITFYWKSLVILWVFVSSLNQFWAFPLLTYFHTQRGVLMFYLPAKKLHKYTLIRINKYILERSHNNMSFETAFKGNLCELFVFFFHLIIHWVFVHFYIFPY